MFKTLEEMAFLETVAMDAPQDKVLYENVVKVPVSNGSIRSILISYPDSLARMVSVNIFGGVDDLDDNEIGDCMLELANVFAGDFLLSLAPDLPPAFIGVPEYICAKKDVAAYRDSSQFAYVNCEGKPLAIMIQTD
jgi:hypothetical protein